MRKQFKLEPISSTLIMLICAIIFFHPLGQCSEPEKKPVVRINNSYIYEDKYLEEVNKYISHFEKQGATFKTEEEKQMLERNKRQILAYLIRKEVLLQAVAELNLYPTAEEIEADLAEFFTKFNPEKMKEVYGSDLIIDMDSLREDTKYIVAQKKLSKYLYLGEDITDEDIEKFYQVNLYSFLNPGEIELKHILIQNESKAEQMYKQILLGNNFDVIWQENSGTIKKLPFIVLEKPMNEMEKAAFALKLGDVSKPFLTKEGWNIIKMTGIQQPVPSPLKEHVEEIRQSILADRQSTLVWYYLKEKYGKSDVEFFIEFGPEVVAFPKVNF